MAIENTLIKRADVIIEDHGITSLLVEFQHGCLPLRMTGGKNAPLLGEQATLLMNTFRVHSLDDLAGLPARVKSSDGMWKAIGHFMEDRWYTGETGEEEASLKEQNHDRH